MRQLIFMSLLFLVVFLAAGATAQPVSVDLKAFYDADTILEDGGTGLTGALDPDRDRIDGKTFPASFLDEKVNTILDGSTSYLFAPLKKSSKDAVTVNGQTISVPNGKYSSIDLALLAAPGSYDNPFTSIQFNYTDGTKDEKRLGPVAGWFNSPSGFDHIYYSYSDNSDVNTIVSFKTNGTDDLDYLYQDQGYNVTGSDRFADGSGFALYRVEIPKTQTAGTLGITVGNNFVISLATEYYDPSVSTTDGYTEIANSMTIYNGVEHKALGNLKLYEFDLAPFLAKKTGELYILFTDGTPTNGWGPYIRDISVYSGKMKQFGETLSPGLDTSKATVYAEFLTNGGEAEKPYLFENNASGPSSRKHRFADGNGTLTYHFDFPDNVTDAKLAIDMANNYVVSIAGQSNVVRYALMTTTATDEKDYLIEENGTVTGGNNRFADGSAYMIYQFKLPSDVNTAVAQITVENEFVIEIASGTDGEFKLMQDWYADNGDTHDASNHGTYEYKLDDFLKNNTSKIIRIRLTDGNPANGWGPNLFSIAIVNQTGDTNTQFTTVLHSMNMYGVDVHDEMNKGIYTADLSSVLKEASNTKKEVYVKFTDGSTGDGWGPGVFWMAAYSGTLNVKSDSLVFKNLKAVNGEPDVFGVDLLSRRYELDSTKTLKSIILPAQPATDTDKLYLLGATLNTGATNVQDWMIQ